MTSAQRRHRGSARAPRSLREPPTPEQFERVTLGIQHWLKYDATAIVGELVGARAAVLSLQTVPFQKRWVDKLQIMELKREVAGTSRIEGADFTTRELDRAMREETPEELFTRSQRQARAALEAYKWIRNIPNDVPIDERLIRELHRKIVTDADDDHCVPGELRSDGQNVIFGSPRHRGVNGGHECKRAFDAFTAALGDEFKRHDKLVQAIAAHFHLAAMHPFLDGNGRTARALEALILQRAGLHGTTFIAMSNYYYEEKTAYLNSLAAVRAAGNDLTPFLKFALKGIEQQANRLLAEIQYEIKRELFRTLVEDLFARLPSPRKRVIGDRQRTILGLMLDNESMALRDLIRRTQSEYDTLGRGVKALIRDLSGLLNLRALTYDAGTQTFYINLDWPSQITETEFFESVKTMPLASTSLPKRQWPPPPK